MSDTPLTDAAFHRYNETAQYHVFIEEVRGIERTLIHAREALRTSYPAEVIGARLRDYEQKCEELAFQKSLTEDWIRIANTQTAELTALREQVRALEEDRARLDFLESGSVGVNYLNHYLRPTGFHCWYGPEDDTQHVHGAETMRAAIDAAANRYNNEGKSNVE